MDIKLLLTEAETYTIIRALGREMDKLNQYAKDHYYIHSTNHKRNFRDSYYFGYVEKEYRSVTKTLVHLRAYYPNMVEEINYVLNSASATQLHKFIVAVPENKL